MNEFVLRMIDICKGFPGVQALDKAKLNVRPGTVHALMGENGAGKSTMMKCLFGIYKIDSGEILLDGNPFEASTIKMARENGISIIQQELSPLLDMSIMENMWLTREPSFAGIFVDHKKMYNDTKKVLEKFNLDLDPRRKLSGLPVAKLQLLEIMNAVSCNARIIIMDEPTSALTDKETRQLFEIIADLKRQQVAVIYISHKLDEIFEISDEVTVMRDGKYINHHQIEDITMDQLIREMVGRDLDEMFEQTNREIGEKVLEVKNLSHANYFKDVSFDLKQGEILGIAGLVGAGRTEILETIFGMRKINGGEIYINGQLKDIASVQTAQQHKIALLTEDRRYNGIFPELNIMDNILIVNYNQFIRKGFIKTSKAKKISGEYAAKLNVKMSSINTSIKNLSGGNQQKVLLARWLMSQPEILLLDEPTRGIDVGAKAEIYSIIFNLAAQGKSIIMVSSEMPEIMKMCDRVIVMHEGKMTGTLSHKELSEEAIMALASNFNYNAEGK